MNASADHAAPRELAWARTRRLQLAEFTAGDVPAIAAMHADPRVRAQLIDDYPLEDPAVAREFVAGCQRFYRQNEGFGMWKALLANGTAAPTFTGWFNLMPIRQRPSEVELGSRLAPAAWGTGLAQEGGGLLLDHAFDRIGLTRVWGICHPANRSAQAALAALGFEPVGEMPFENTTAAYWRIKVNVWRELRDISPTSRIRRALSARRGRQPTQENARCVAPQSPTLPNPTA